jgi:uncharacterized membrane protein (DUF485 family)
MLLFKLKMLSLDYGALFGYTVQLIAFTAIFFGIKKYRDDVNNGSVTFGKALGIGLLIALIAGIIYCITWEIYFQATDQQFIHEYSAMYLEKLKSAGASDAEILAANAEMDMFRDMYRSTVTRFLLTLAEIFPTGLLISLISSAILRRKK